MSAKPRTPLRVLLLDDCREDRELYRRFLVQAVDPEPVVEECETIAEGLARIAAAEPHCLVLDHHLPDGTGLQLLDALRASPHGAQVPVVLLTGGGNERLAVEALRRGAHDYVPKSGLTAEELRRAIHFAMKRAGDEQQLRRAASVDELTGTWNRRALLERLSEEAQRARRRQQPICVGMLDLDHFKAVNDRHGHRTGDAVLSAVGVALRDTLRAGDFVGRYGGEEFCVVWTETPLAGARIAAERLRREVERIAVAGADDAAIRVSCSVGIAELGRGGDPQEALERADRALYRAKAAGRNRVETAPPLSVPAFPRA